MRTLESILRKLEKKHWRRLLVNKLCGKSNDEFIIKPGRRTLRLFSVGGKVFLCSAKRFQWRKDKLQRLLFDRKISILTPKHVMNKLIQTPELKDIAKYTSIRPGQKQ